MHQGRRNGSELALVQQALGSQPDGTIVEHRVVFRDHFQILSRTSTDRGVTGVALSRWEYERQLTR